MKLNLLTKKLYQYSFDKLKATFLVYFLFLSLIYLTSNIKVNAVTGVTDINVGNDDAFSSNQLGSDNTLVKVSSVTTITGCKDSSGTTTNQGSVYIMGGPSGLITGVGSKTQMVSICKGASALPDKIDLRTPGLNRIIGCSDGGGGAVNCTSHKVEVPKTTFQNPTTTSENYLETYKSRNCDDAANKFLPICTNVSTQLSSAIDTKINIKVTSTSTSDTDVDLNFDVCYYQGVPSGDQSKLISVPEFGPTSNLKCQCITFKKSDGTFKNIAYVRPDGSLMPFFDGDRLNPGGSVNASYDAGKRECLSGVVSTGGMPVTLERYYGPSSNKCFDTLSACKVAENNASEGECQLKQKGDVLYKAAGASAYSKTTYDNIVAKYRVCSATPTSSACTEVESARRCECSLQYNPYYDPVWCSVPGADAWINFTSGACKDEKCKLVPLSLQLQKPSPPQSPLAFINVLVNVLFWLAVLLFILNFITAGIEMIRSGDEPDKMKEATERITSSIFGFIFILIISGLVNYLIDFIEAFLKRN